MPGLPRPHQDLQPVIRQADVRRQQAVGALVRQVVADVGEEGAPGAPAVSHGLDGAVHGGVRGMRLVAQRVQKQHVQAAQQFQRGLGNLAVIGEIGGRAEAEAVDGLAGRAESGWAETPGRTGRRPSRRSGAGLELRNVGVLFFAVEDVAKTRLDGGHGLRRGVDRNGALLPEIERPHVVQAHDVVGVGVGEDHRIEAVDARAQRLLAVARTRAMSKLSQALAKIIGTLALPDDVTLAVDIDPVNLG